MNVCGSERCYRPTVENICSRCRDEVVDALRQLANGLLVELDVQRTRQNVGPKSVGGAGGAGRPLPYGVEAADLAFVAASTVNAWALSLQLANEHLRVPDIKATIADRATWVSLFPHLIAALPDAGAMHGEVMYLAREIVRLVDNQPSRTYLGVCSAIVDEEGVRIPADSDRPVRGTQQCEQDIFATPEATWTRCRACGTEHVVSERRSVMLEAVRDAEVTVAEAVSALPEILGRELKGNTIRTWIRTGALAVVGKNSRGLTLIRIGDLIELSTTTPTRNRKPKAVVVAQIDLCA